MTSAQVLDKPAVSMPTSMSMSLSSIAPRWILANVLPQVLLVVASALYLSANGITLAQLITKHSFDRPAYAGWAWIAVLVVYFVIIVWVRGAVLRPLVPRFSWLGWVPAAFLSGVGMLLAAVGGGLVGVAIAKGLAMSGSQAPSAPTGLALAPFVLGNVIAAEVIGVILGGLPGLILGTGEALAAFRTTRRKAAWILWSTAAWSAIAAIITLHVLTVVYYPALPAAALAALAIATPILIGLAAALLTLPAVARLARQQSTAG
jgi:hypothetical protein